MNEKPSFRAELQTTGIGSLPFADPGEAAKFVLDVELWPAEDR